MALTLIHSIFGRSVGLGGRVGRFVASSASEVLECVHDGDFVWGSFPFAQIVSLVVSLKMKDFQDEGENGRGEWKEGLKV